MSRTRIVAVIAVLAAMALTLALAALEMRPGSSAAPPVDEPGARPADRDARVETASPPAARPMGRWRPARRGSAKPLSPEEEERLAQFMALPYLQGYRHAPDQSDVTLYDRTAAYEGLNLVVSGHAPAATVVDMEGRTLHTWGFEDIHDLWPSVPLTEHTTHWRRVYWYPGGEILALYEGVGMIKLTKDSKLLWKFRGGAHHDVDVTEKGLIYVLSRRGVIVNGLNRGRPVLEDFITILRADGTPMKQVSLLRLLLESKHRDLLQETRDDGDIFHTNTIQVFDGRHADRSELFRKGNVLISILHLDTVAIVDTDRPAIVWAVRGTDNGLWNRQHEPILMDNGNMLLFNNNRRDRASIVLEFEPLAQKVVWSYRGTAEDPFFSNTCGTSQRLPNGNTLITESDNGRAFEVTVDGRKVWEYVNPHRAGEDGQLIATLLDVMRVDPDFVAWIED